MNNVEDTIVNALVGSDGTMVEGSVFAGSFASYYWFVPHRST